MNKIQDKINKKLMDLIPNEVIYTTSRGTDYFYVRKNKENDVIYSINKTLKTLPYKTIVTAHIDNIQKNIIINSNWYRVYNEHEYKTRPCNLSVLKRILNKI